MRIDIEKWPEYSKKEIELVSTVLKSNRLNYWTGQQCRLFEREFKKYIGVKYSVAVANGSVGLDLAVSALKLKKDSEVIVTARSYITSVSCVVNNGFTPIFADVDFWTQNLSSETIQEKITKKTKAIILVHLGGMPCDMKPILKLAKKFNLKIIEDCSQAHGATYDGKIVGSMGDISVWSFCNDKIINTCGEGGMVTTNNRKYFKRIWSGKDCGRNFDKYKNRSKNKGFKWAHDFKGTNLRMTEVQAIVGRYQLKKLNTWIEKRNKNAKKIMKVCKKFNFITFPRIPPNIKHAFYRCYIYINKKKLKKGWNRNKIVEFLNNKKIECNTGSCPEIYLEKVFRKSHFKPKQRLLNCKLLGKVTLAFSTHPNLSRRSMEYMCASISSLFKLINK
jgi:dTDP-4-amino-4,6-dideoxygalactose transaminase